MPRQNTALNNHVANSNNTSCRPYIEDIIEDMPTAYRVALLSLTAPILRSFCARTPAARAFHIACYLPNCLSLHCRQHCRLLSQQYNRASYPLAALPPASLYYPHTHGHHQCAAADLPARLRRLHARPVHSQTPQPHWCIAAGQPAGLGGSVSSPPHPQKPHAPRAHLCPAARPPAGLAGSVASIAQPHVPHAPHAPQTRTSLLVWEFCMPRRPACRGPVRAMGTSPQLRLRLDLPVQQAHPPGEAAARGHAGVQLQHLPLRLADGVVQQRAARSPAPHRLQGTEEYCSLSAKCCAGRLRTPASALQHHALSQNTG